MPRSGRPMKYRAFLEALDDNQIYTPATIARLGEELGLFEGIEPGTELSRAKLRVRHAMARRSANYRFPVYGDGQVILPGQGPLRGWSGERWKASLPSA